MSSNLEYLVRRAKNEDKIAFSELYDFFKDDMYRFAYYYLGSREAAEDCVSEATLIAFQKLPTLKKDSAFKSWLFKILHNCCNKAMREIVEAKNNVEFSSLGSLSTPFEDKSETMSLVTALNSLDSTDREIIVLYFSCGYTSKEIGDILSLNDSTVRSKIKRTTEKLREKLSL